jgi:uridine kinase
MGAAAAAADLDSIVARVQALTGARPIVAVSGFGGAGKSTLAVALRDRIDGAVVAGSDEFHTNFALGRSADWACVDRARMIEQLLDPFRLRGEIRYQRYDWHTNEPGEWRTTSGGARCLIVEGVGILHPDLLPFFDLTVWVDVPPADAMARAVQRNLLQGAGPEDAELWRTVWAPNDRDFFAKHRPRERADLVYVNEDGRHAVVASPQDG